VPGPLEFFVWCTCFALEVAVVVCAIRAKVFRRFLPLNLYMAASAVSDVLRFRILAHYGFTSSEYVYFYYYSDALLTIALYLALLVQTALNLAIPTRSTTWSTKALPRVY